MRAGSLCAPRPRPRPQRALHRRPHCPPCLSGVSPAPFTPRLLPPRLPARAPLPVQVKVKAAQKFLGKGHRVKLTLQFRGREMEFQQIGREMFQVGHVL